MPGYVFRAIPPRELGEHLGSADTGTPMWVVRVTDPEGAVFSLSLQSISEAGIEQLNEAEASVIIADLFRPGWTRHSTPMERPYLVGGEILYGFRLQRTSRLGRGSWEVRCVMPGDFDRPFNWKSAVRRLDTMYRTLANGGPDHV